MDILDVVRLSRACTGLVNEVVVHHSPQTLTQIVRYIVQIHFIMFVFFISSKVPCKEVRIGCGTKTCSHRSASKLGVSQSVHLCF